MVSEQVPVGTTMRPVWLKAEEEEVVLVVVVMVVVLMVLLRL